MKDAKPPQDPRSKADAPPATSLTDPEDREPEPMDEAKARKALHKIAEVEEKLEPRG